MKLGEFIEKFSHNNIVRLVYKNKGGHEIVLETWDDASMDWEINQAKGKNRHFVDNEVLGLVSIRGMKRNADAINIVIEKLETQPFIEEVIEEQIHHSEAV